MKYNLVVFATKLWARNAFRKDTDMNAIVNLWTGVYSFPPNILILHCLIRLSYSSVDTTEKIYWKDAPVVDFADLPRREQFHIASTGIKIVAERDAI